MAGYHIAEALSIPYFRAFTMTWTRTRYVLRTQLAGHIRERYLTLEPTHTPSRSRNVKYVAAVLFIDHTVDTQSPDGRQLQLYGLVTA